MEAAIASATSRAAASFDRILGRSTCGVANPVLRSYTRGSTPALIPDVGEGDPERRGFARSSTRSLQQTFLDSTDAARVRTVLDELQASSAPEAKVRCRRLTDLASDLTNHEWLWAINPAHGYVLSARSFSTALKLRLGVPVAAFDGQRPCAECGREITAPELGSHGLLCAKGRRVIGHNMLRDHVAALARVSDSSTTVEAAWASAMSVEGDRGTTTAPDIDGRRPADILTSATPLGGVGFAALDVGITTPFTFDALRDQSLDVLDEYRRRKLQAGTSRCRDAGWEYHPLILSAFGRPHETTAKVTHHLCVAASKAFGGMNIRRTEAAWWKNAGTLLMERAARMIDVVR
jgi:hypothetical protein